MKLIDYAEEWRAGLYISLGTEYTLTASSTENGFPASAYRNHLLQHGYHFVGKPPKKYHESASY